MEDPVALQRFSELKKSLVNYSFLVILETLGINCKIPRTKQQYEK